MFIDYSSAIHPLSQHEYHRRASTKEHMEYYENRLKTFDTYPKQMLTDKVQLARARLYYTGKSDVCRCFLCHVKLNAWERDDDAIKEHYKWSPQCEYIKMVGAPQKTGFTFGIKYIIFWRVWNRV